MDDENNGIVAMERLSMILATGLVGPPEVEKVETTGYVISRVNAVTNARWYRVGGPRPRLANTVAQYHSYTLRVDTTINGNLLLTGFYAESLFRRFCTYIVFRVKNKYC